VKLSLDKWDLDHLQTHLQAAAELEAWTIPFYLSAMTSIVNTDSEAYALIRSVVNQEMLHLQLVSNIANSYGYSPRIGPEVFVYEGTTVPHLDFTLDPSGPTGQFAPYSAEIGPLDELRINAMCLIEYPEWDTGGRPDFHDTVSEYGSIGEFYDALEYGAALFVEHIKGGVNQVNWFDDAYDGLTLTVSKNGVHGLAEVALLLDIVRDQGEAAKEVDAIKKEFQSSKDDPEPAASHYEKFMKIRAEGPPATYEVKDPALYSPDDLALQNSVVEKFAHLTDALTVFLSGGDDKEFGKVMAPLADDLQACWKQGVAPRFNRPPDPR